MNFIFSAFIIFFSLSSFSKEQTKCSLIKKIQNDLKTHVVWIIVPPASHQDDDEGYGDWAYYLNDFSSSNKDMKIKIHKLAQKQFKSIFPGIKDKDVELAEVFMKKDFKSYYLKAVMEPDYRLHIKTIYSGVPENKISEELRQYKLTRLKGSLAQCKKPKAS